MSRGVGLLGHWQQRNCYSRVFSLRHSSTIRIQWGGPKYCSRPCTPDAAGLRLKSSHVGPPELLQPFFRGLAGQLSPACCSLASLGWSQPPPQTRLGLASPWSGPAIGQWRRPPQPITGRDDGAWCCGCPRTQYREHDALCPGDTERNKEESSLWWNNYLQFSGCGQAL